MSESTDGIFRASRTVAIHQPNFFPWLGYFDKLVTANVFVLLDHVQFPKTGGVWCNRVKLMVAGEARWVTAPIVRSVHGVRAIHEVEFQHGDPWRSKLVRGLTANYARAPHFRAAMPWIEPMIMNPESRLAHYNASAILAITSALGIPHAELRWSSELDVHGHATDMLIEIARQVNASEYLCGGGASGYQDDAAFARAGIALRYQQYQHPVYMQRQGGEFTPGLSILDAIMHLGADGVRELLVSKGVYSVAGAGESAKAPRVT